MIQKKEDLEAEIAFFRTRMEVIQEENRKPRCFIDKMEAEDKKTVVQFLRMGDYSCNDTMERKTRYYELSEELKKVVRKYASNYR